MHTRTRVSFTSAVGGDKVQRSAAACQQRQRRRLVACQHTRTQHKIWLWQCFLRNKVFSACLWDLSAFWWMKLKQLTLITALKGFQDSYRQVTKYFKKPIPSNILYFNKKSMCKWLKEPIAVTGDIRPKRHHAEHSFTYLSPPSQPRCV